MNQRTHLRFFLSAAVMAAFLFSAANVHAAPPHIPTVNLILWIFSDGLNSSENSAVAAYQVSHPDVGITVYHPTDLMAELNSAPLASLPDLIYYPNDTMAELLLNHYLTPLDPYGVTPAYLTANFEPAAAEAAMFGGKVFAIPHLLEGIALLYNKDTLPTQYVPAGPLDFAGLAANAAQFAADYPGKTLICNQAFGSTDAYHAAPIFFGFGIPDYIDQIGHVYIRDPKAVNAAAWIQDLRPVSLAYHDFDICKNGLIDGSVGMWWTGPWAVTWLNAGGLSSDKIGLIPMGVPYLGVKQNMVTVFAVHRGYADEAVDFLKYFDNPSNSIQYAVQENLIPANSAALSDPAVQSLPLVTAFASAYQSSTPLGKSIYSSCQWGPVGDAVLELWNNPAADPQALLDTAHAQVQECVNNLRSTYFPYSLNLPLLRR